MRLRLIVTTAVVLVAVSSAFAQSSRRKKRQDDVPQMQQPNSVDPNYQPQEPRQRKTKHSTVKPSRNPEQEFYERMAEVEKTRRKNERMMDDPQYSDPMYFGHKKPPKKHKPGKMKFCKVCGIRH